MLILRLVSRPTLFNLMRMVKNSSYKVQTCLHNYLIHFHLVLILKCFIVLSDGPLFPPEHEMSLKMEGLEKPKRKRGRPPKAVTNDTEKTEVELTPESITIRSKSEGEGEEEDVDDTDGRRRRKRKVPSRFQEALQVNSNY